MKKALAVSIAIMLLMTAAAVFGAGTPEKAATGTEPVKKVLRVGWPYEPATLDPDRANTDAEYNALRMMVESLVRNVNGQAVPGVASSWDVSSDNKVYTFHLRTSTFSDGSPVTAQDFSYSLFRLLDPKQAFENASSAFIIKNGEEYYKGKADKSAVGIQVVDDHTLKLTMKDPTFPIAFANWVFSPMKESFVAPLGKTYGSDASKLLTNGPFNLTTWNHDSKLVLVKNPDYWNANAVHLNEIDGLINAAGDTAVDMMLAGQLDLVELTNKEQAQTLIKAGFSHTQYSSGYQYLHINHKGKTPETGLFLSNTDFRRALNLALDRNALVATVYTADAPAYRIIAPTEPGAKGYFDDEHPYTAWPVAGDAAKAKQYLNAALKELGKTADQIPTFTMLGYDSQSTLTALQAMQDMLLKTLGIKCTIDPQPIQTMISKVFSSDYDFWKGGVALGDVDWLDVAVGYTSSQGPPYNYVNKQYDALYNSAAAATNWKTRKDRMFTLEKFFCDNVVDLQLTWTQDYVLYNKKLTGFTKAGYLDYTFANITP